MHRANYQRNLSVAGLWNATKVHGFYTSIFGGAFSRFVFAACACFFIFCFRALSLSFLPLSPIAHLPFHCLPAELHDHNSQTAGDRLPTPLLRFLSVHIRTPSIEVESTRIQLPATVTNPVVRVSFCDGALFASATITMGAAATVAAADRCCRCAAGLCPCLLRGARFDQKETLVVHAIVSLSHPSDHSVSHINRIKRHIAFVPI
jgi:hypothetical protein